VILPDQAPARIRRPARAVSRTTMNPGSDKPGEDAEKPFAWKTFGEKTPGNGWECIPGAQKRANPLGPCHGWSSVIAALVSWAGAGAGYGNGPLFLLTKGITLSMAELIQAEIRRNRAHGWETS